MRKFALLLFLFLLPSLAWAGNPGVVTSGNVTANDIPYFMNNWTLKDSGVPWSSVLTSVPATSTINLGTSASSTNPQRTSEAGTGLYSDTDKQVEVAVNGTNVFTHYLINRGGNQPAFQIGQFTWYATGSGFMSFWDGYGDMAGVNTYDYYSQPSGFTVGDYSQGTNGVFGWSSGRADNTHLTAMISNPALGIISFDKSTTTCNGCATAQIGNGLAALKAAGYMSTGTKFTASGCSNGTTVGGATAGQFTLGANTCSVTITMNGASGLTAPNGWSCKANDETTAAANSLLYFSSNNTTTATLSVPATAGTSDVIDFHCMAF